jgi:hypothetical protein
MVKSIGTGTKNGEQSGTGTKKINRIRYWHKNKSARYWHKNKQCKVLAQKW